MLAECHLSLALLILALLYQAVVLLLTTNWIFQTTPTFFRFPLKSKNAVFQLTRVPPYIEDKECQQPLFHLFLNSVISVSCDCRHLQYFFKIMNGFC